ncbi:hypothetical protein ACFOZY_02850 [Chungangia koreensis]|uniref:Group-specific protein n=1 Tax=Chungangia koreensis TaxID=752657 RepID=A0ABV8X1F5_9LACT
MLRADLKPMVIKEAYMSYILPFAYQQKYLQELGDLLQNKGYTFFNLDNNQLEDEYYGNQVKVLNEELDQYFLPYVQQKLFPKNFDMYGFHRFSKRIRKSFKLEVNGFSYPFKVESVDVFFCPFGIAFLTMRTELTSKEKELSDVLNFMNYMRVAEPKLKEEKGATIVTTEGKSYENGHTFLFDYLCPDIKDYIIDNQKLRGYFGSLPYFEDERMFVTGFLFSGDNEELDPTSLYRMGHLDGRDPQGKPYLSTTNKDYIDRFYQEHIHDRWAPYTYTVTTEHAHIKVSRNPIEESERQLSQYMGTHYYNLILHYFYRVMLLRLSFEYSDLEWNKDEDYIRDLIELITIFSSRYYFGEVSARTEGKELSKIFLRTFHIDDLYAEVKGTLHELYQNQENIAAERQNQLLFMLTVFTVISGIVGMNLVIEDWKGQTGWSAIQNYNFMEWITLLTAAVGILLSISLFVVTIVRWLRLKIIKKLHKHF